MKNLFIFAIVIGIDQFLKFALFDYAHLNSGIAFGLLSQTPAPLTFLYGLVLFGLVLFLIVKKPANVGWIFILAGVASNFIDRLRLGAIIDPIIIGQLPAFNLADMAIIGGIILITYIAIKNPQTVN